MLFSIILLNFQNHLRNMPKDSDVLMTIRMISNLTSPQMIFPDSKPIEDSKSMNDNTLKIPLFIGLIYDDDETNGSLMPD